MAQAGTARYESAVASVNENGTKHYVYLNLGAGVTQNAASIPPYANIGQALLTIFADTSTASNKASLNCSLTNSNGGTTYLSNFIQNKMVGGNGSSTTNYDIITHDALNWFHTKNASAGQLNGYGGSATYIQCYFNLFVLTKYTFAAKYQLDIGWENPKAIVTVTGGTGSGTYHYGETCTITATPPDGYKFVKWSDGNTNASRTITVDDNFLATHKAFATTLNYEAVFEVDKINKIYVGTQQPKDIYIGTSKVKGIYIGTTKVYG